MISFTLGLYTWYRFAMWLQAKKHTLRHRVPVIYYFGLLLAGIGLIADVIYNITIGSLVFLQAPRIFSGEFTLSQRLRRIHEEEAYSWAWRVELAHNICEKILNKYDPSGKHC